LNLNYCNITEVLEVTEVLEACQHLDYLVAVYIREKRYFEDFVRFMKDGKNRILEKLKQNVSITYIEFDDLEKENRENSEIRVQSFYQEFYTELSEELAINFQNSLYKSQLRDSRSSQNIPIYIQNIKL
jgi:hypothetical protein